VNREQRRARARLRAQLGTVQHSGACPDCDADVSLTEMADAPGVFVAEVRHDPTCPRYRAIVAQREEHR